MTAQFEMQTQKCEHRNKANYFRKRNAQNKALKKCCTKITRFEKSTYKCLI